VGGTGGAVGGTGGSVPVGEVGTLGAQCSPPAALACAGYFQKVTLVCGASGTWEVNQTCPGTQVCETHPGLTVGTCQEQDPDCAGPSPGAAICVGHAAYQCGADNVTKAYVAYCPGACTDGACDDAATACPTIAEFTDCSDDCGGRSMLCVLYQTSYWMLTDLTSYPVEVVVRTPRPDDLMDCGDNRRVFPIARSEGIARISEPWHLAYWDRGVQPDPCAAEPLGQCLDLPPPSGDPPDTYVLAMTDDPTASPTNVIFEPPAAPGSEACP
jgi:hypothetical protein